MNINLGELAKLPSGIFFQMEGRCTDLNEHESFTYPAEMACLCQKGKTYTDGRIEYRVIVPLVGRVVVTPIEEPLTLMSLSAIAGDDRIVDVRDIIKVWAIDELVTLTGAINNGTLVSSGC